MPTQMLMLHTYMCMQLHAPIQGININHLGLQTMASVYAYLLNILLGQYTHMYVCTYLYASERT